MKITLLRVLIPVLLAATATAFVASAQPQVNTPPSTSGKGGDSLLPVGPEVSTPGTDKPSPGITSTTDSVPPAEQGMPSAPATSSGSACHNSGDPACGPLALVPTPGANQPIATKVSVSPEHPAVGQKVTYTVSITDPDAPAQGCAGSRDFGDYTVGPLECDPPVCARFGEWDAPQAKAGSFVQTFTHVFAKAGTFTATFPVSTVSPGWYGCAVPYGSTTTATATVDVTPTLTVGSVNGAYVNYQEDGNGGAGSASKFVSGEPQPDLDLRTVAMPPKQGSDIATLFASTTNNADQTVYFPHGLDVIVHLCRGSDGSCYDAHVTDPSTTEIEPGQKIEAKGTTELPGYGGYSVHGQVTYAFMPAAEGTAG
ncbi:MAG TPA: hypothetical protein VFA96_08110 [Nocardioides sp.]|nr:hypothetical protein [Nocardioides sp.]